MAPATSNDPVERVRDARSAAVKLTVYHIPPDTATLSAISPAALESFPDVVVDDIEDAAVIESALAAIEASRPTPSARPLDARYGLVFSDATGTRVLGAYKGAFATRGQIDEQPCDFNELALHAWLVARYPPPT